MARLLRYTGSPDKPLLLKPLHLMNLLLVNHFWHCGKTHVHSSVSDLTCAWQKATTRLHRLRDEVETRASLSRVHLHCQQKWALGVEGPSSAPGAVEKTLSFLCGLQESIWLLKDGHLGRKLDLWGGFAVASTGRVLCSLLCSHNCMWYPASNVRQSSGKPWAESKGEHLRSSQPANPPALGLHSLFYEPQGRDCRYFQVLISSDPSLVTHQKA